MDNPLLTQREIEARILEPVLEVLTERLGREEARALLGKALCTQSRRQGAKTAQDLGRNDLEAFKSVMARWNEGGALELSFRRDDPEALEFDVTRCAFAEAYERLGLGDLGTVLSCNRDFAFLEGFNPDLVLERETTLMEGGACCPFRYRRR